MTTTNKTVEEFEKGNWHDISGPNGMCECGTEKGNCHARMRKMLTQVREETIREIREKIEKIETTFGVSQSNSYEIGQNHGRQELKRKVLSLLPDNK